MGSKKEEIVINSKEDYRKVIASYKGDTLPEEVRTAIKLFQASLTPEQRIEFFETKAEVTRDILKTYTTSLTGITLQENGMKRLNFKNGKAIFCNADAYEDLNKGDLVDLQLVSTSDGSLFLQAIKLEGADLNAYYISKSTSGLNLAAVN